jgi:pimeloyl-ACP methyl ester carboxylesterase/DNA-binding winged helix-turn-helix (wHTH) protein
MEAHDADAIVELQGFVVDLRLDELRTTAGERLALRPQAFAVLKCLARSAGQLVSKDELVRDAWRGVVVTDDSLVQCIKLIREALGDDDRRILLTEPKRGYRLVPAPSHEHAVGEAAPLHQDIRFATSSDGVRIAYATCGERGPHLVRAPHWMTHVEWDGQNPVSAPTIRRLARNCRYLRHDGRGSGLSDRDIPLGTIEDEVRDLEAVVDAAGLERFALLGRSGGGAIAIRYAARHPGRVSHLIFVGGLARGWIKRANPAPPAEQVRAFEQLVEHGWGNNNAAFRQLIASEIFPGASAEQREAFLALQRVACKPRDAARLVRMIAEYDVSEDLPRVRCPTLVLHSPHDQAVPFEEARLIASSIPGARLEPFDSLNHTPLPGEPAFDEVYRLIDEFLLPQAAVRRQEQQAARPVLRAVAPAPIPRPATIAPRGHR